LLGARGRVGGGCGGAAAEDVVPDGEGDQQREHGCETSQTEQGASGHDGHLDAMGSMGDAGVKEAAARRGRQLGDCETGSPSVEATLQMMSSMLVRGTKPISSCASELSGTRRRMSS